MKLESTQGDGDERLPFLTEGLPGVGGSIKNHDEDFVVEEIPRYDPCGEGTHVFFMIEKQGLTTRDAVSRIARGLGCRRQDVGYAGLKDSRGVTRQVLSVEHVPPERVAAVEVDRIKVLWAKRHGNKLRLGHLSGNRFAIRVRRAGTDSLPRAQAILDALTAMGMPNYFGPQRFGMRGTNALVGRGALTGDFVGCIALMLGRPQAGDDADVQRARSLFDEGSYAESFEAWPHRFRDERNLCRRVAEGKTDWAALWKRVDRPLRKLFLSAFQSRLFNRVVAARIGELDQVKEGDLAWLHRNGACFTVEDVAAEQVRCANFEISPSGPMFGKKMTPAGGEIGELERGILVDEGIDTAELLRRMNDGLNGARRALRVPVSEASCSDGEDGHGAYLELRFALPPGSYATSLVREVCKG